MITKSEESRRNPRAAAARTKCFHVAPSSHWWSESSDSKVTATAQSSGASREIDAANATNPRTASAADRTSQIQPSNTSGSAARSKFVTAIAFIAIRLDGAESTARAGIAAQPYLPCDCPSSARSSPLGMTATYFHCVSATLEYLVSPSAGMEGGGQRITHCQQLVEPG